MPHSTLDANQINLRWLLRLRWGAIVGQVVVIAAVSFGMGMTVPLPALALIIVVESASNLAGQWWASRAQQVNESALAILMVVDVVFLTALLHLTGGPFNPFSFWYLVHIALAAVVLRPRLTWLLTGLSLGGFGWLFLAADTVDHHQHAEHFDLHIRGMWVAFGIAAGFIVYFIQRVTRALADRDTDLAVAREKSIRQERLMSLATLAAGAAHELATPLSTIAVAAKELERQLGTADTGGDIRLIREQVSRCREILNDLSVDAGQSLGEAAASISLGELLERARAGVHEPGHVLLDLAPNCSTTALFLPARALARALQGLMENACQASAPDGRAIVHADVHSDHVELSVRDEGAGMTGEVLARAGEPFFTTKQPGEGMGLGLFLARVLIERLGGQLEISSAAGAGTTVRASLPCVLDATKRRIDLPGSRR